MLREWLDAGAARPAGPAYAVTPGLREWYREGDTEELEYVAATAAAAAALRLIAADPAAPRRRVVLAAEVPDASARPAPGDRAAVALDAEVPRQAWGSALLDDPDAEPVVAAAVAALAVLDAPGGSAGEGADAEFALEEAAAHELGWYALQELPHLLG